MKPVTELIGQTCKLYKKHLGLLAGYTAWLLLPYAATVLVSLPTSNVFSEVFSFFFILIQGILALWLGTLIPSLVRELVNNKTKIPITDLQSRAWHLVPSVVFVAILESAVVLGGFIMLIIPAFIFWVWFAMAQLAVILDNKKGMEAMAWSREISRNKFWSLAWRLIAGPFVFLFVTALTTGLIITIMAVILGTSAEVILGLTPPLWAELISNVIETFSLPFFLIYYTLLYLDLSKPAPSTPSSPTPSEASAKEG
ncbi:MAG: hypothetical protein WC702_04300 [Patescibacteria group bacterium]|jgi:hypothetical protein